MNELIFDNRILWPKNSTGRPRLKRYLSDMKSETTGFSTLLNAPANIEGTKVLNEIIGEKAFAFPKPNGFIQVLIEQATDKNSLILDSFAGSGTTAHTVLKQNAEDGGNRHFILVEMDPKIAREVTAERVRRVCSGYTNAKGKTIAGLGGGFQFCKLSDEPLFTPDGQIRSDVTFAQLAEFVWFTETGTSFNGSIDSPLLGVHEGRAVYLLYNGILKDLSLDGGNILTGSVYENLLAHDGPKVIYAAACRLGAARLTREQIAFKQTPYALEV